MKIRLRPSPLPAVDAAMRNNTMAGPEADALALAPSTGLSTGNRGASRRAAVATDWATMPSDASYQGSLSDAVRDFAPGEDPMVAALNERLDRLERGDLFDTTGMSPPKPKGSNSRKDFLTKYAATKAGRSGS